MVWTDGVDGFYPRKTTLLIDILTILHYGIHTTQHLFFLWMISSFCPTDHLVSERSWWNPMPNHPSSWEFCDIFMYTTYYLSLLFSAHPHPKEHVHIFNYWTLISLLRWIFVCDINLYIYDFIYTEKIYSTLALRLVRCQQNCLVPCHQRWWRQRRFFPPPVSLKFSRDDRRIVVYFLSEVGFFELGLQKQWGSLGMIGDVLGEQSSFGTDEDFLKRF